MGYPVLRVHTAHDDLEFKTLEPKDLFDNVVAHLERLRNQPTGNSLTNDEFKTKKAELLARLWL